MQPAKTQERFLPPIKNKKLMTEKQLDFLTKTTNYFYVGSNLEEENQYKKRKNLLTRLKSNTYHTVVNFGSLCDNENIENSYLHIEQKFGKSLKKQTDYLTVKSKQLTRIGKKIDNRNQVKKTFNYKGYTVDITFYSIKVKDESNNQKYLNFQDSLFILNHSSKDIHKFFDNYTSKIGKSIDINMNGWEFMNQLEKFYDPVKQQLDEIYEYQNIQDDEYVAFFPHLEFFCKEKGLKQHQKLTIQEMKDIINNNFENLEDYLKYWIEPIPTPEPSVKTPTPPVSGKQQQSVKEESIVESEKEQIPDPEVLQELEPSLKSEPMIQVQEKDLENQEPILEEPAEEPETEVIPEPEPVKEEEPPKKADDDQWKAPEEVTDKQQEVWWKKEEEESQKKESNSDIQKPQEEKEKTESVKSEVRPETPVLVQEKEESQKSEEPPLTHESEKEVVPEKEPTPPPTPSVHSIKSEPKQEEPKSPTVEKIPSEPIVEEPKEEEPEVIEEPPKQEEKVQVEEIIEEPPKEEDQQFMFKDLLLAALDYTEKDEAKQKIQSQTQKCAAKDIIFE